MVLKFRGQQKTSVSTKSLQQGHKETQMIDFCPVGDELKMKWNCVDGRRDGKRSIDDAGGQRDDFCLSCACGMEGHRVSNSPPTNKIAQRIKTASTSSSESVSRARAYVIGLKLAVGRRASHYRWLKLVTEHFHVVVD